MDKYLFDTALKEIGALATANNVPEVRRKCFACLDLTSLNVTDNKSNISKMVDQVNTFRLNFDGMPNVAAICVYPALVPVVRQLLQVPQVKIASVAAGFPAAQTFQEVKIAECLAAIRAGADELDIVISVGRLLSGEDALVAEEVGAIRKAIGSVHLKVILETGALKEPDIIRKAAFLAMESGADFIKTSTGKIEPAATPEAFLVMAQAVKEFYQATGKQIGLKPAGGVVSIHDAVLYYSIVQHTLGETWLTPEYFRIGASRLANELLGAKYFG